ncbi:hypothetical protein DR950_09925 [Kitasatospora xanthocidica]|uniref:Uncharacterized protein n=1 Tax=Kitasatospora xanthocidica TaxID=83382 RepID=A0A372ZQD0_9ACTN|nr:hypothetical protein [Kitasatospora xanthocidica]RGD58066.1 hypothetical protein DR950_09925 [Kitasatospora xanthocidica]
MPDYFDRLVAKGGPGGDTVRVRPRLPGPFERIETLGAAPPPVGEAAASGREAGQPGPAPLPRPSAAPRPLPSEGPLRPALREAPPTPPAALPLPRTPLLVTPPLAPARVAPAAPAGPGTEGTAARPVAVPAVTAPVRPSGPEQAATPPPATGRLGVAPAARRPAAAGARAAAQAARGRQRPAERVVRVQIGRVEVRAAERAPAGPRRAAAARPSPALDLGAYLDRERP